MGFNSVFEGLISSKISVKFYQITRRHFPEDMGGKLLLASVKSTKLYGNLAQSNMSVNKRNEEKVLTVKGNELFDLFPAKNGERNHLR